MKYVLFHDDSDGFASALAAKLTDAWKDATYITVQYGQSFPYQVELNKDTEILIVDFSYRREVLEEVNSQVKSLLVIDHHKTAQEELKGLPYAIFDLNEAGATLTWKHLHTEPVPDLFKYVGDRDLWRFQYKQSRWLEHGINASGRAKDLNYWLDLYEDSTLFNHALYVGRILQENVDGVCTSFVKSKKYSVRTFPGLFMPKPLRYALYNCTSLISEQAEAVYRAEPELDFVMSYFILPETGEVVFSLRAGPNSNIDVGRLAKCFGGGGHPRAAGFKMPYEEAAVFVVPGYTGTFEDEKVVNALRGFLFYGE